jgi:predicted TIM-barrel fold metal-dependent hydrolase
LALSHQQDFGEDNMASHTRTDWHRRAVLGGLATAPLAGPTLAALEHVSFKVPDGACDCHHHIYDPRWAYAPTAVLRPAPATAADYRRYQARIGAGRSIAVTPSTYAFNNECTADFLRQQGARAVGVAVVPDDVDATTLKNLHAAGFRGARLNIGPGNPLGPDAMMPLARRIAPLGWHMQLNLTAPLYAEHQDVILKLPVTVVVDHMAEIPGQDGVASPAFAALRRFIDAGKTWVKLSGPDSGSKSGPPGYADRIAIARALVTAAPERCVWGSNWPFPSSKPDNRPDAVLMLDLVKIWAPDEKLRQQILVENPERLYGFDPRHRPAPLKA